MVRINRVYTRKGDEGETRLVGGVKTSKDHPRVEAYGTVDELNSLLGIVRNYNKQLPASERKDKFEIILQYIQQWLFDLGSELATPPGKPRKVDKPDLSDERVKFLEDVIDRMNEELPALKSFVLPGGSPLSSFLHQSRTVCRRAERLIVSLGKQEDIGHGVIPFINRLSDALFVFARWAELNQGENEILWQPGLTISPDWQWADK